MPSLLFQVIVIILFIIYVNGIGYDRGYKMEVQSSGYNADPIMNHYYNVPSSPIISNSESYDFLPTIQNNVKTTTQKALFQLDSMITLCFQTICKEWIHECHWYCDDVNKKEQYDRCTECLSWRGRHCRDCFNL